MEPYIVIDDVAAHADAPNNLVIEYRAWRSKADFDAGLPPVKQDTHTQALAPRRLVPVRDVEGRVLAVDGTPVDEKSLAAGEVVVRARLVTPDHRAALRARLAQVVKQHLGDARDLTIPKVAEDSEGALRRPEVAALKGLGWTVK